MSVEIHHNSVQEGALYLTDLKFTKQDIIDLENKIKSNTNNNTFHYSEVNKSSLIDIFAYSNKSYKNKNIANHMNYYIKCLWNELDGIVSTKRCENKSDFLEDLNQMNYFLDHLEENNNNYNKLHLHH